MARDLIGRGISAAFNFLKTFRNAAGKLAQSGFGAGSAFGDILRQNGVQLPQIVGHLQSGYGGGDPNTGGLFGPNAFGVSAFQQGSKDAQGNKKHYGKKINQLRNKNSVKKLK